LKEKTTVGTTLKVVQTTKSKLISIIKAYSYEQKRMK
jgi:hypothetical protein